MTHTRLLRSWARLTAPGIPAFVVIRRPLIVDFRLTLAVGEAYPAPDRANFAQMRRARQLYEQRRIGIAESAVPATSAGSSPGSSLKPSPASASSPEAKAVTAEIDALAALPEEASAHAIPLVSDFEEDLDPSADQEMPASKKHKKRGNPHGS
jgi:hypothetical protein